MKFALLFSEKQHSFVLCEARQRKNYVFTNFIIFFFFSLFAYNLQTKQYRTTPQGAWKYIATLWRLRITSELKLHNTEVSLSA